MSAGPIPNGCGIHTNLPGERMNGPMPAATAVPHAAASPSRSSNYNSFAIRRNFEVDPNSGKETAARVTGRLGAPTSPRLGWPPIGSPGPARIVIGKCPLMAYRTGTPSTRPRRDRWPPTRRYGDIAPRMTPEIPLKRAPNRSAPSHVYHADVCAFWRL